MQGIRNILWQKTAEGSFNNEHFLHNFQFPLKAGELYYKTFRCYAINTFAKQL